MLEEQATPFTQNVSSLNYVTHTFEWMICARKTDERVTTTLRHPESLLALKKNRRDRLPAERRSVS